MMAVTDPGPVYDCHPVDSDCDLTATVSGLDANMTRGILFKTTQDSSNYVTLTTEGGNSVKTDEWAKGQWHPFAGFTAVTVTGTVKFQIGI